MPTSQGNYFKLADPMPFAKRLFRRLRCWLAELGAAHSVYVPETDDAKLPQRRSSKNLDA